MTMLISPQYGDRNAREMWNILLKNFSKFFVDLTIEPALLHCDIHGGNVADMADGPGID